MKRCYGLLNRAVSFMTNVEYDRYGRMTYNPDFHFNHRKPLSLEEKAYMCKFWDIDGPENMSLALGRTGKSLSAKVHLYKKDGSFNKYQEIWNRMEEKEA